MGVPTAEARGAGPGDPVPGSGWGWRSRSRAQPTVNVCHRGRRLPLTPSPGGDEAATVWKPSSSGKGRSSRKSDPGTGAPEIEALGGIFPSGPRRRDVTRAGGPPGIETAAIPRGGGGCTRREHPLGGARESSAAHRLRWASAPIPPRLAQGEPAARAIPTRCDGKTYKIFVIYDMDLNRDLRGSTIEVPPPMTDSRNSDVGTRVRCTTSPVRPPMNCSVD